MISRPLTTFLLALLGACAAAWLAALMREKNIRPVQDLAAFFKRQTKAGRVVLGTLFVALWMFAGVKPDLGGGGNGTNGVQMAVRPPGGGEAAGAPLPRSGGEALGEAAFPSLPGAATNEDWLAHGAFEDWFYVCPSNWWARAADGGWVGSLRVFSSGGFEARGEDGTWRGYPPPFPRKLSVAPRAGWGMLASGGEEEARSVFWHGATPSNTLLLTWQDALYARSHTNLVSFQAELFNDGSAAYRYGGPAATNDHAVPLVLPFDRDGDGLADEVDPDPDAAGPDAHGTNAEWYGVVCSNILQAAGGPDGPALSWREGVNSNAYYFVDVVAARGPAPIRFAGDRACRLGDPVVVALAGETNRVPLLIGVGYAVTSDTPFSVSFPVDYIYPEVETNAPCAARICWPLEYMVSGTPDAYTVVAVPSGLDGTFEWDGAGGGMRSMPAKSGGCGYTASGGNVAFGCGHCGCGGCSTSGTYSYEAASFALPVLWCGCWDENSEEEPTSTPHEGPEGKPSVEISFDRAAVIFEDGYANTPDDWVDRRSSSATLTIKAYGGPRGATLSVSGTNLSRLEHVGGDSLPSRPVSVPSGRDVTYRVVYAGCEASGSESDIRVNASISGGTSQAKSASITSIRLELTPDTVAPDNPSPHRHVFGVHELVACPISPRVSGIRWEMSDCEEDNYDPFNVAGTAFWCPWKGGDYTLYAKWQDATFETPLSVVEPVVVCQSAEWDGVEGSEGVAGQVALVTHLYVVPRHVSFEDLQMQEVPDEDKEQTNGHDGYFNDQTKGGAWSHTVAAGAGRWIPVHTNGYWCSDRAGANVYQEPWTNGWKEWRIPVGWGQPGIWNKNVTPDPPTIQRFTITTNGTVTVRKYGHEIKRATNNKVWLDGILQN